MKSLMALTFLILLSSCGETGRTRTIVAHEEAEPTTNALEAKTTKKCTTGAALKLMYSTVVARAKKDSSGTIYEIYASNSQQFNSTYSNETGTYMDTAFFIEMGGEKFIYSGKMNLSTCEVVSLEGSKAQSVSEEGNQI